MKEGKKWATTPLDIAKEISKGLASSALISQVNGVLWDMSRPLVGDCELKLFTFDSDEGRDTFWHSSAHILGQVPTVHFLQFSFQNVLFWIIGLIAHLMVQALEMEYGCKLCIGPCTTRGEVCYMHD